MENEPLAHPLAILQLLSNDCDVPHKSLLENSLKEFLSIEATAQLNEEQYERSDDLVSNQNRASDQNPTICIGNITLYVPRLQDLPLND